MTAVFADTVYFVALLNPRDQHHHEACQFASRVGPLITTAWVVTEVANQMSRPPNRQVFLSFYRDLETNRQVEIVPPSVELFRRGLDLFGDRGDKQWSLTDCISFAVMEREQLTDALTADRHFEQAGFRVLLR